jgi:hypothetical protein
VLINCRLEVSEVQLPKDCILALAINSMAKMVHTTKNAMTDFAMLIDVWMVDGSGESSLRRHCWVSLFHIEIKDEGSGGICTLRWL